MRATRPWAWWMNMENFVTGFPANENAFRQIVRRALGAEKADYFFERYLDYFFTHKDADFIRSLGMNLVRLSFNYRHFEDDMNPNVLRDSGFKHLDRVVEICAARGVHVMMEKPLAVSIEDARAIERSARAGKINVMVNYDTTWYRSNKTAFDLVHENALGEIRKIVVHDGHRGPKEIGCSADFLAWLTDPVLNGGGAFVMPVLQEYAFLSLAPFQIKIDLNDAHHRRRFIWFVALTHAGASASGTQLSGGVEYGGLAVPWSVEPGTPCSLQPPQVVAGPENGRRL